MDILLKLRHPASHLTQARTSFPSTAPRLLQCHHRVSMLGNPHRPNKLSRLTQRIQDTLRSMVLHRTLHTACLEVPEDTAAGDIRADLLTVLVVTAMGVTRHKCKSRCTSWLHVNLQVFLAYALAFCRK